MVEFGRYQFVARKQCAVLHAQTLIFIRFIIYCCYLKKWYFTTIALRKTTLFLLNKVTTALLAVSTIYFNAIQASNVSLSYVCFPVGEKNGVSVIQRCQITLNTAIYIHHHKPTAAMLTGPAILKGFFETKMVMQYVFLLVRCPR